ncbi:MAG: phosphate ABC transporter substrate-binding protein PstS family protein, partial [Anaerolineae bacterium]|nr:phosphate ABC transporter substrate-binding protein PstS family protein [Anaerolineae bacterium]
GETDISNASRAINEKETAACQAAGIEPVEFFVGVDALSVVVNPENPVKNVTLAQLAAIYSGQVTNWKEIDPAFDAPIKLFSPGTDSGTFDYFVEIVLNKDKKPILEANPQLSENDNVLVQGVEGDKGAIGYFGFAYYQGEGSKLKALALEGVEPNAQTAESGEYKLARPLFIYSTAKIMKDKPQVAGFINFYLGRIGEALKDVGYFPTSADATNKAAQNFVDASK